MKKSFIPLEKVHPVRDLSLKGFTLIEIMIVVAIIALLAAIAIPNLLRARVSAWESTAAAACHAIVAAQVQWRAVHSTYATLADFAGETPAYVDSALIGGSRQGYNFSIGGISSKQFYTTAAPQAIDQAHTYYVDEDGILCRSDAVNKTAESSHWNGAAACPAGYSEVE